MDVPIIIDAIVRLQALVRLRQYQFDEFKPPGAEPTLALYRIRRLRNPGWVNLCKESFFIAEIYASREPKLYELEIITDLIDLYSSKLGTAHGSVIMLGERLHLSVVAMQEQLQEELDSVRADPAVLRKVIDKTKSALPLRLRAMVTDFAEVILSGVCKDIENELSRKINRCKSANEINALLVEAQSIFQTVPSQLIGKMKIVKLEREDAMRETIKSTWPINGSLLDMRSAARNFVNELGASDPLVAEVLADIRKRHRELKRQMETEFKSAELRIFQLIEDLKNARVRILKEKVQREITEFEQNLEISLFDWANKVGPSETLDFAKKLLRDPKKFLEKINSTIPIISPEELKKDDELFSLNIQDAEVINLPNIDVKAFQYCESEAPGTPPPLEITVCAKLHILESSTQPPDIEELFQLIGRKCQIDKDCIDVVGRAGREIFLDLRVGGLFEELTAQIARGGLKGISAISRLSEKDFSTYHNLKAGIQDLPKPVFFSLNVKPVKIAERTPMYSYYSDNAAGLKPYSPPKATFTVTRSRI